MKIAFLTEMELVQWMDGNKVPANHPNMRTEFAWMHALDAEHYTISDYARVEAFDAVIIIFPKGRVFLDACGSRLRNERNPVSGLLASDLVDKLKQNNSKVFYMQEGPHWLYNDYELVDQVNFYNMLVSCDGILAHNSEDVKYYKGLLPGKTVTVLPTLMIEDSLANVPWKPEEKAIIGGNFARWYGGFESYIVAQEFDVPIWGQTSHAMRDGEDQLFPHLPRVFWTDWMKQLSSFKYAVHLMPTVAAGTFSLNCAYFGIPCIGNEQVDTQRVCHPELSVQVHDTEQARKLAFRLREDKEFYNHCSNLAKSNYQKFYSLDRFKKTIKNFINE
jgi:hypothetical protein